MEIYENNTGKVLKTRENWQTRHSGTLTDRYEGYLAHADDGKGNDITTGKPLKSFDEWLGS